MATAQDEFAELKMLRSRFLVLLVFFSPQEKVRSLAVLGSAEVLELGDHGSSAVKPSGRTTSDGRSALLRVTRQAFVAQGNEQCTV